MQNSVPSSPSHGPANAESTRSSAQPQSEPLESEPYEESLISSLDLANWISGENMAALYANMRMQSEVDEAVSDESERSVVVRRELFPQLAGRKRAAPNAGLHAFGVEHLEKAHRGFLFNGAVEACDGTVVVHDTLPLTITQIGVCTVSYNGDSGSYAHRHYRRDLRERSGDELADVMALLERRSARDAVGIEGDYGSADAVSQLARRGLMAYAERAILLQKCGAPWRMGHGHPAAYELLAGPWASRPAMMETGLAMMRNLVEHKKWVFVPSAPRRRGLITLGNALRPLEYLIIMTAQDELEYIVECSHARGDLRRKMERFAREVGEQIVVGMFRVSATAPAYIFYAHADYAREAALIAMADSALQLHRGFPMLIDLADRLCAGTFDASSFIQSAQLAYANADVPFAYAGERETRKM